MLNASQKQVKYTFHIRTYFDDFRTAVDGSIRELSASTEAVRKMENAFQGKYRLREY